MLPPPQGPNQPWRLEPGPRSAGPAEAGGVVLRMEAALLAGPQSLGFLSAEGRWPEDEGLTPRDIQKAPLGTVGEGSSGTWGCCECANLPPALILARRVGLGLFRSSPPAPFSSCETRTVSPSPMGRLWDFLLSSTSRERRALPYSHHQLVKVTAPGFPGWAPPQGPDAGVCSRGGGEEEPRGRDHGTPRPRSAPCSRVMPRPCCVQPRGCPAAPASASPSPQSCPNQCSELSGPGEGAQWAQVCTDRLCRGVGSG